MIFVFVVIFLFIFGWFVIPGVDIISLLSVFFTIYLFKQRNINNIVFSFTKLIFLYVVYNLIILIINGGIDSSMFLRIGRLYINFLGGVGLIYWLINKNINNKSLLNYLFWSIAIHGLLMSIMYFTPSLRLYIYNMANTLSIVNNTHSILGGYRIPGLTYGLSQTSVVQGWGLLLGIYLLISKTFKTEIKRLFILIAMPVLIFSIFISGRSGVILSFIGSVVLLLTSIEKKSLVKYILVIIVFFSITSFTINWFRNTVFINESLRYTQYHINEAFTFLEAGESSTIDTVKDMYLIPQDIKTFFFGSSTLDRDFLSIRTDVGYIRILYHSGIIGSIFYYLPFLFLLFYIIKKYPKNSFLTLVVIIFVSTLILHGKEVSVYTRNQWSIQILMLFPIMYDKIQREKLKKNML